MSERLKKFLACPHYNVQSFTEYCLDCGENRYTSAEEIMRQEGIKTIKDEKVKQEAAMKAPQLSTVSTTSMNIAKAKINKYTKAQGFWKVTTEGDCEGRSTRDLGMHFGFIDDIAFALADQCYYSLCFKEIEPFDVSTPTATKVNVTLDIDSGTWDMSSEQRRAFMENLLADRDTAVEKGEAYASVNLVMGKNELQRKAHEKEMLKKQALSKLSEDERAVLLELGL